jgi:hypothetical protein
MAHLVDTDDNHDMRFNGKHKSLDVYQSVKRKLTTTMEQFTIRLARCGIQ